MMMMSEGVSVPPWGNHLPVSGVDAGGGGDETPFLFAALRQYLPCNDLVGAGAGAAEDEDEAAAMAAAVDAYACDEFRMYDFKVRRAVQARDACEYAHRLWTHQARYPTTPCKDGTACRRRVCFFAHTPDQLRAMPSQHSSPRSTPLSPLAESYDGSPLRRQAFESYLSKSIMSSSPTSTLLSSPPKSPPSESPPLSPDGAASYRRGSWPGVGSPVNDVLASLRQLRLAKAQASPSGGWSGYPTSPAAYGSPKAAGLYSLPTTPMGTQTSASSFMANLEPLNLRFIDDEEPVQRVESGRALREQVFERLSRDGAAPRSCEVVGAGAGGPDVGWGSDPIN
uniref:C3H1-type domain-containing protein n=1 Tax=Aegilops tauschii TaxID=37682 RepID=M8AW67_AEGTA